MALPNIIFNKGEGGLGRPLTGQDFVSGMIFYTGATFPTGWTSGKPVKSIFSIADARAAGILPNYNQNNPYADANFVDATAAGGKLTVTTVGAVGDVVTVTCLILVPSTDSSNPGMIAKTVTLCVYIVTTADHADTSGDVAATNITAAINALSYTTGFSAAVNGSNANEVDITCPKSQGVALNGSNTIIGATPLTYTRTGTTFVATKTQPANGTQSLMAIWYYHISEFFRLQPNGQLYVGFFAVNSSYNFVEITTVQNYAKGSIRQIGIYLDGENHSFASGDLTAIDTQIKTYNDVNDQPLSALYAADLSGTTDLSTLTNLNTLSANKATAVIGQDGGAHGAFLFATYTKSITCLGAALGAVSFAKVSESIMWHAKFNLSNGTELDTPALANGQLIPGISQNYLVAIDNLRYVFIMKYVGQAGSWFNNSHTATNASSDYAYLENNRTIDKADRGIYSSLFPQLGAPLLLNTDGTLADTTIAYFISLANVNLNAMVSAGELSAFVVTIPTTQNVQTTGNLVVNVQLVGVGVARNITVNIGYVLSITGGQ